MEDIKRTRIEGNVVMDGDDVFEFSELSIDDLRRCYERMYPYMNVHPATLFISKDATPPKVFTEEQVKALLNAMVKSYEFYGDLRDLLHVADKHGISLES